MTTKSILIIAVYSFLAVAGGYAIGRTHQPLQPVITVFEPGTVIRIQNWTCAPPATCRLELGAKVSDRLEVCRITETDRNCMTLKLERPRAGGGS